MQISWFTVIAQMINFLILVWLLKKFLYTPVLKMIDEREKTIADRFNKADIAVKQAKEEREKFEVKNSEFDAQKQELLEKAKSDAQKEKQKILDKARVDQLELKKKLGESFNSEKQSLKKKLSRAIRGETFEITKKIIEDLADITIEKQIINVFIERLDKLSEDEKKKIRSASGTKDMVISIQTAYKLREEQRKQIEEKLSSLIDRSVKFEYNVDAQLLGGVELIISDYKIGWSIDQYIKGFFNQIEDEIESEITGISV